MGKKLVHFIWTDNIHKIGSAPSPAPTNPSFLLHPSFHQQSCGGQHVVEASSLERPWLVAELDDANDEEQDRRI